MNRGGWRGWALRSLLAAGVVVTAGAASAQAPGDVWRASVSTAGVEGTQYSYDAAVSADGRCVAFVSVAPNLVPGDTNGASDVFVRDLASGETTRVSVSSTGGEANEWSYGPSLSGDGRFVLFQSSASNLVPGDTNGFDDIFVHDRAAGTTTRASVGPSGEQADLPCFSGKISGDGRFAVFQTYSASFGLSQDVVQHIYVRDLGARTTELATKSAAGEIGNGDSASGSLSFDGRWLVFDSAAGNLLPNPLSTEGSVFLLDRVSGHIRYVCRAWDGSPANGGSQLPQISADGRFISYQSWASNLVQGDTNQQADVFVHDRRDGTTQRVSVSSSGEQSNEVSGKPSISANGRYVVFDSHASNLVDGDTNQTQDVFRRDLLLRTTELIAFGAHSQVGNDLSLIPAISGDGTIAAFESHASNLVPGDRNGVQDVFVRVFPAR